MGATEQQGVRRIRAIKQSADVSFRDQLSDGSLAPPFFCQGHENGTTDGRHLYACVHALNRALIGARTYGPFRRQHSDFPVTRMGHCRLSPRMNDTDHRKIGVCLTQGGQRRSRRRIASHNQCLDTAVNERSRALQRIPLNTGRTFRAIRQSRRITEIDE